MAVAKASEAALALRKVLRDGFMLAPGFDCLGVEAPFTWHDKYTG
jgi:hypothetical protein